MMNEILIPSLYFLAGIMVYAMSHHFSSAMYSAYSQDEFDQMTALDLFEGEEKNLITQRMQDVFVKGAATAEAALIVKTKQKIPYYFTGKIATIDGQPYLVGRSAQDGVEVVDKCGGATQF